METLIMTGSVAVLIGLLVLAVWLAGKKWSGGMQFVMGIVIFIGFILAGVAALVAGCFGLVFLNR